MNQGLVHLYWGNGKGKTTAAMGLALRALCQGLRVTIVQFLKDGCSGELDGLRKLGAVVIANDPSGKFTFEMTDAEKQLVQAAQNDCLHQARKLPCDLLVLDEACCAWESGMIDQSLLHKTVLERPAEQEIILTGRSPAPWMREMADYSTEMVCHRHPFERGIQARKGVEY
ncbi:MAG: cob(I)yrinic acid a,c-diamide adenosyltransferase [Clostridia bacterium]